MPWLRNQARRDALSLSCRGGGQENPGTRRSLAWVKRQHPEHASKRVTVASARSWIVKTLHGMRDRLVRQGGEILIVFVLALLGGACGWLLRDQLVKREELRRETSHLQTPFNALASEFLLAPGGPDRMAGKVDQLLTPSMGS
jgi:hypothetical protein